MVIGKIKKWYKGKPIRTNSEDSPVVFFPGFYYKQPKLALILKILGKFWIKHWGWIIGIVTTIILGILAIIYAR